MPNHLFSPSRFPNRTAGVQKGARCRGKSLSFLSNVPPRCIPPMIQSPPGSQIPARQGSFRHCIAHPAIQCASLTYTIRLSLSIHTHHIIPRGKKSSDPESKPSQKRVHTDTVFPKLPTTGDSSRNRKGGNPPQAGINTNTNNNKQQTSPSSSARRNSATHLSGSRWRVSRKGDETKERLRASSSDGGDATAVPFVRREGGMTEARKRSLGR